MLDVQVRHRLGSFTLDLALAAGTGVTVLVGESGSGKTTLLRLIAGLVVPDQGRIVCGGKVLVDRANGRFVSPEARAIGYVSQDYGLFPHLSVRDNVAFGLRAAGLARRAAAERAWRALEGFDLGAFAARRPRELSGGQQQRVALARALVLEPEVLLLDEPLSALDVATRRTVRAELRRILAGLPCATLFVTHQPTEALAFGEQIAVLESGRITQRGSNADFLRHPESRYVAEFLGVNYLEGEIVEHHADGSASVRVEDGVLVVPDPGWDGAARLLVHPHDIVLSTEPPAGSARNVLRGAIDEMIPEPPHGERLRVLLATRPRLAVQVMREAAAALSLGIGHSVYASFKATGVTVLPR